MVRRLKARCERLRRQIDTLTGQYADAIPAELQSLKRHVREKGRQLTTLEAEQASIEAELKRGEFTQAQQATITGLVARYRDRILNADAKTRRYIVELFDVQVRMHYTEAGERRARVSCGVAESDVMSVGHAYQDPSER